MLRFSVILIVNIILVCACNNIDDKSTQPTECENNQCEPISDNTGSGENSTTNLCADISCGDNGRCSIVNDSAICLCDENYHPVGLNCIADIIPSDPPIPLRCTDGVDCYCDQHPELVFCEDFADNTFGSIAGFCSNNGGPWPNCEFIRFSIDADNGFYTESGITDLGVIRAHIASQTTGQVGAGLAAALSEPMAEGNGSFGVLIKGGPSFWGAFSSANKFIAFRPAADDPRQVAFMRPADNNDVNGCTPGTYSVINASGGGGAARSFDEFGNSNPFDSNCQHSIKLGNNLANQWVYIEWEIHAVGGDAQNALHIWLRDGSHMVAYAPVQTNTTQYSVELFHWQEEATGVPDENSYAYIDLFRVSHQPMGPPAGFLINAEP